MAKFIYRIGENNRISGERLAQSLYNRLGGYDSIYNVVDEMMKRIVDDGRLAKYFAGHGDDSKQRLRQLMVEQICQITEGHCFYLGRDMKTVHKGMGISGSDWQVMKNSLLGAMDSFKVPDREQQDVLKLLNSIKEDIVEMP